uniref:CSON015367 protein n=1 Tax=Culicoides sonorensis TaxID=179676 RepID=A0A336MFN6_CULSO
MKRKKKEEGDSKEPKPKKYKKKIENPEKQKARYVYDNKGANGKLWEKNRRDRLNNTFDELALLLPQKDPPVKMSKVEILAGSIKEIENLRKKVDELVKNGNSCESTSNNEPKKVEPEKKDASSNTDTENKENQPVKRVHKKTQVNFLKKKKKVVDKKCIEPPVTTSSLELKITSSSTQTSSNEEIVSTLNCSENNKPEESKTPDATCSALVPFTQSPFKSMSNTSQISMNTSPMRITPALISTPIMTPSLFISNYPLIVSQVPQSVLIVNNKSTAETPSSGKVVAVKSKTMSGHVPLPPLKKSVAVKKAPRKKRILKKKSQEIQDVNVNENKKVVESKNDTTKDCENHKKDDQSVNIVKSVSEQGKSTSPIENIMKNEIHETSIEQKKNEPIPEKSKENLLLPITPKPVSSGKSLERLELNTPFTSSENHHKTFSPASQDTSNIHDTSAISNLDIENLSLLTANIFSAIDTNDTNLSSNLGKMLEDKELHMPSKHVPLMNISEPVNAIRKGLLQTEHKPSYVQNINVRSEQSLINKNTVYTTFNSIPNPSASEMYPNFSLSLSQEVRTKSKPVTEPSTTINSKPEIPYSMTTTSYSSGLNYSSYYSNTSNVNTSMPQLYSNHHTNNIISSNYSKTYDPQRPFYVDQPSTNFTFSLTSAAKSSSKYVTSGNKLQNSSQSQSHQQPSVQDSCKKYNNTSNKTGSYNYVAENVGVKNMTSHSIAKLNSKYDNHKENDTPFYLNHDVPCSKSTVVNKVGTYNQSYNTNNSSCARYSQQQQHNVQPPSNKTTTNPVKSTTKSSSHNTQQPQMSSRYDVDWMSSSEIKPSTNDFQLFPSLDSSSMNQNSYYSSSISNFDINRKTSDLYFAHPPGEDNLPWSPSRMSNILDAPHLSGNQCFSSTLPNLHGDLALNTLSSSGSSRPNSIFETPTKNNASNFNSTYSSTSKDMKRSNNSISDSQQNNSFSVRQLVDINQPSKTNTNNNDKIVNVKRKSSSSRKEGETETFNNPIIPYENQKPNIYSAESLINPRNSSNSKNKTWHSDAGHLTGTSHELNHNNSLFSLDQSVDNQYNYPTTRYEPKFFNQNYVTSFVDNSFSNSTQNFHNFSKSQAFTFTDSNTTPIDYHQNSLGNTMNPFLSHHDSSEKHTQNYYPQSNKNLNSVNVDSGTSLRNSHSSSSHSSNKKSKSSHHVPTSHHSLGLNYDFPVTPVTPSLTYFPPTHDWKSTPTEPYPSSHHSTCNSNAYANSSNLYSQNILQNSQTQNLASSLGTNMNHNNNGHNNNQNTSNSLTNFNLSTICPEINDKVRQQNW